MLNKDTAVCIRAIDYSETSQIVTFFAKAAGKIDTIAKGSKRPKSAFGGTIEILSSGEIVFSEKNKEKLAVLTEFQQTSSYSYPAGNLYLLNCSLFAAELINSLTIEHDPNPELFDNFLSFLQEPDLSQLILFQLILLREVGLKPILNACVNCKTRFENNRSQAYFSSSANGLVCKDCEANFPDRISLSRKCADILSNVKLIAKADKKTLKEIEKILIVHFTELLHKPPKMAKYVLND